MKQWYVWALTALMSVAFVAATPQQAEAAFRVGVDGRLIPLGTDTVDQDGSETDFDREPESYGFGARFLLGLDILSIGARVGFNRHIFEESDLNFSEINVNAMGRIGVPMTGLAAFVEGGPAFSLDWGGIGYNIGVGLEYDIFDLPLLGLSLGVAGQYANLPVGDGDDERDVESLRGIVFIAVDLAL